MFVAIVNGAVREEDDGRHESSDTKEYEYHGDTRRRTIQRKKKRSERKRKRKRIQSER